MKLIGELRKATNAPMNKASAALAATNNDFDAAVAWLADDALKSGAAKAAKLAGRSANEGTLAVAVLADGARREAMAQAGRSLVDQHRGATGRTLALVERYIDFAQGVAAGAAATGAGAAAPSQPLTRERSS